MLDWVWLTCGRVCSEQHKVRTILVKNQVSLFDSRGWVLCAPFSCPTACKFSFSPKSRWWSREDLSRYQEWLCGYPISHNPLLCKTNGILSFGCSTSQCLQMQRSINWSIIQFHISALLTVVKLVVPLCKLFPVPTNTKIYYLVN